MKVEEAEALTYIESTVRRLAQEVRRYRIEFDSDSNLLENIEDNLLEEADKMAMLSRPIKVERK